MFESLSTEVRWFASGMIGDGLLSSFKALADDKGAEEEQRTDYYLVQSGLEEVGIKLREGRCEFKHLMSSHTNREGEPMMVGNGRVEATRWQKISFETGTSHRVFENLFSDHNDWMPVKKHRWLIFKQLNDYDEANCQIELSNIEINNSFFCSLCFESKGANDLARDVLANALDKYNKLISQFLKMDTKQMDYPAFLLAQRYPDNSQD